MGRYFSKGLAESTQRAYSSSQRWYLKFCKEAGLQPLLASESVLCYFTAYLAKEKLKHCTIKAYLSGVRFLHIAENQQDPFCQVMNHLHYVLQGIKRCESEQLSTKWECMPISPNILRRIKQEWEADKKNLDTPMLWAACCLAFFSFLRIGEMVMPGVKSFDSGAHLCINDITIDNSSHKTIQDRPLS